MFRDPQLIITFQLALIGIVLIGGLFLIWKAVTRIEEKVDMLLSNNISCDNVNPLYTYDISENKEDDEYNNDLRMKELFGNLEDVIENNTMKTQDILIIEEQQLDEDKEQLNDIKDEVEETIKEDVTIDTSDNINKLSEDEDEVKSEATLSTTVLSRNRLRQMRLEQVQQLCLDRNLSMEGTKNQLIERLLQ